MGNYTPTNWVTPASSPQKNPPRHIQTKTESQINNLKNSNRSIMSRETEAAQRNLPKTKIQE